MAPSSCPRVWLFALLIAMPTSASLAEDQLCSARPLPAVRLKLDRDFLEIVVDDVRLLRYVWRDEKIGRPYFAHLLAPSGVPLSRRHPPLEGQDATDHADFHPGLWLAFGDISGHDYWRLKARVEHAGFLSPPDSGKGWAKFVVRNRYMSSDGRSVVCHEEFRFALSIRESGYLLLWESLFTPADKPVVFGDQEEMGLAVRLSTPLTVANGGRIVDSQSRVNGAGVWGKQSAWCDYHGIVADQLLGITLMPHPDNFRASWFHARDYGLLAANPFGSRALGGGEKNALEVTAQSPLRLRYGLLLHSRPADKDKQLGSVQSIVAARQRAYQDYLQVIHRDKNVR